MGYHIDSKTISNSGDPVTMPGLLIKDLPLDLHARLKRRARLNRRSMSAEAIMILQHVLAERPRPTLEQIDARRVQPSTPMTEELVNRAKNQGRP